jgi:Mg2+ and Co2+ transporter CorA
MSAPAASRGGDGEHWGVRSPRRSSTDRLFNIDLVAKTQVTRSASAVGAAVADSAGAAAAATVSPFLVASNPKRNNTAHSESADSSDIGATAAPAAGHTGSVHQLQTPEELFELLATLPGLGGGGGHGDGSGGGNDGGGGWWVDVDLAALSEGEFERLAELFALHAVTRADCLHEDRNISDEKMDSFESYLFCIIDRLSPLSAVPPDTHARRRLDEPLLPEPSPRLRPAGGARQKAAAGQPPPPPLPPAPASVHSDESAQQRRRRRPRRRWRTENLNVVVMGAGCASFHYGVSPVVWDVAARVNSSGHGGSVPSADWVLWALFDASVGDIESLIEAELRAVAGLDARAGAPLERRRRRRRRRHEAEAAAVATAGAATEGCGLELLGWGTDDDDQGSDDDDGDGNGGGDDDHGSGGGGVESELTLQGDEQSR